MRNIYLLLFWFLISSHSLAQSITIEVPNFICLDQESRITYGSTATFASDNQFTVDIRGYNSDNYIKTFPATVKDGKLVVIIKDLGFPDYVLKSSFQARIVATKPVLRSDWSNSFYFSRRPTVTLTSPTVQTVNPFEPTGLQFLVDGSSSVNVVLSDSSRFTLSSNYFSSVPTFSVTQTLTPKRTTTYTITEVSNICGVGNGNGSAMVQVNPIGVRTTSVSATQLCIGSELRVGYSTTGNGFGNTNQFKIRLTAYNINSGQEDPSLTYDLDAVAENGVLKTTIPTSISVQTSAASSYYTVRVRSTQPATLSDNAGYYIAIRPAPSAEFVTASRTINIGQSVDMWLKFQGLAPFGALISDNSVARADFYQFNDTGVRVTVRPLQTTTYKIKSLQTGCGPVPANTTSSVIITVNPGIALDSVTADPICEGQRLRIKFSHNLTLGANNQFSIRIRSSSGLLSDAIPTQQQGDYLLFDVPTFKSTGSQLIRNQAFSFQISSTLPAVTSEWQGSASILTYPTMKWSANNVYSIDKPQQQVGWYWTGEGGGPFQLDMETGETASTVNMWDNTAMVFVAGNASRNFRVKTIKNACFVTNNPAEATLTVKNTDVPFIYVTPIRKAVCRGDSVEITFQTKGDFALDNQFRVQVRESSSCCTYPDALATTTKAGIVKFKMPTEFGWNSTGDYQIALRVASTNPVVFSDDISFAIHRPVYNVSVTGQNDTLLLQPSSVSRTINYLGGTPVTINYSLEGADYSLTSTSIYSKEINFTVNSNTTFTLKSLTNACGSVPANRSIPYRIVPYTLQTLPLANSGSVIATYCAGSTLALPYIMTGQPDPAISLSVQFREANGTKFKTLATNVRTNPVVVTLPDTLQTGDYVVRLLSNLDIPSVNQTVRIRRKATAQLTTENGASSLDILPTSASSLKINLTGSPSWTVIFNNGQRQVYTSSPGTLPVSAKTKTVYAIQAVTNACGYGTTSGEVVARVKPVLSLSTNGSYFCKGTKLPVSYSAQGDFETGNRLKIGLVEAATVRWLDSSSVTQGTFQITLPSSLTPGLYSLRLASTNPVQETNVTIQLIAPPVISILGNSVINPQQAAIIRLKSDPSAGDYGTTIRYTLSSGVTGEFFSSPTYNITVKPTQTTTYQLTSVSNNCGAGVFSGAATVTVNPTSDRQITTQEITGVTKICTGDTVQVPFDAKGAFSTTNRFTVQLSDSSGSQFTDLPTFGDKSPLKALVPANLIRGAFYHVRVMASDPDVSSSTNPTPLTLYYGATAAFESSTLGFKPGGIVKLKINLTGDAPWAIKIGNEFNPVSTLNAISSPYTVDLSPTAPSTVYKLYQVSNVCGVGRLANPVTTQINLLTASDELINQHFSVYPNPTNDWLHIRQDGAVEPYTFWLTDIQGKIILQKKVRVEINEQDLSKLPTGVYLLHLETDKSKAVFRILKH
jgi:hypothetical protein